MNSSQTCLLFPSLLSSSYEVKDMNDAPAGWRSAFNLLHSQAQIWDFDSLQTSSRHLIQYAEKDNVRAQVIRVFKLRRRLFFRFLCQASPAENYIEINGSIIALEPLLHVSHVRTSDLKPVCNFFRSSCPCFSI